MGWCSGSWGIECGRWWWLGIFFFFKQKTAYGMRISDWSSDVCSSDLGGEGEDDVEIADRKQVGLAGLEPGACGGALASEAVPVPATVVRDPPVAAVGTGLDVPAESGGAAMLDRRQDRKSTRLNSSH